VLYSIGTDGKLQQVRVDRVDEIAAASDGVVFREDVGGLVYKYTPGSGWSHVPKGTKVTDFGSAEPSWLVAALMSECPSG
jgi:hypothetical protein